MYSYIYIYIYTYVGLCVLIYDSYVLLLIVCVLCYVVACRRAAVMQYDMTWLQCSII